MGILVTANEPTKPMRDAALDAGMWYSKTWGKEYPRIQILSVADLLNGELAKYPGRNVTFAIADIAAKDQEQIVLPGVGAEGLSQEMAKRHVRKKKLGRTTEDTAEIDFHKKKTVASRLRRARRR
jgi:hypothetical protein